MLKTVHGHHVYVRLILQLCGNSRPTDWLLTETAFLPQMSRPGGLSMIHHELATPDGDGGQGDRSRGRPGLGTSRQESEEGRAAGSQGQGRAELDRAVR